MMENKQGIINISKVFSCRSCKSLTYEPIVTNCCDIITCRSCAVANYKCPSCQTIAKFKKSFLLQEIQRNVFVQCPYNCKTNLSFIQLQKHVSVCPEATTDCPYCKNKIKIGLIPQHLGESHVEQCNRVLNQLQRLKEGEKMEVEVKQAPIVPKIQPFKHGTTGQYNINPRLSRAGRLVCGRPLPQLLLPGQPIVNTSGIFSKNRQVCSVQFGSCDRCMELDVDRLSFPKGCLLNMDGRICYFIYQKRKVACNSSNGKQTCNEELQCAPCRRILDLIQRGYYKKCL